MLKLLAGEPANLTVVGDDDQAIYRWRGAAAANLLAFRRLYPGAREVVLVENYRSTQTILDAAARLVGYNNPYRLEAIAIDKAALSRGKDGGPTCTSTRSPPRPTVSRRWSRSGSGPGRGPGTSPSSCAATPTPTRSSGPST
jgi:superfamily I DNA/RNA helicase